MMEFELMEDIINRLDEAYDFLDRSRHNVGYPVSSEYLDLMNILWDAQTASERKLSKLKDKYAVIAGEFKG